MRISDVQVEALRALVAKLEAAPERSEQSAKARGLRNGDYYAHAHGYLGSDVRAVGAELAILLERADLDCDDCGAELEDGVCSGFCADEARS